MTIRPMSTSRMDWWVHICIGIMDAHIVFSMGITHQLLSDQHPQQHMAMAQLPVYPMVPTLPSTPMYARPNSSCSRVTAPPPTLYSNGPGVMTPVASPQPSHQKPTILLETDGMDDNLYFPSTPPLSSAGSSVSSPNTCDMLQTPMNPMFSGLDGLEDPKEMLEPVESVALDWSSCGSPPMTPGKPFPQH
ncbi:hypothetical protein HYQ46_001587 [Verticillium longisporum]|nr:hypothetical protein HYQ46_001587 [Verticillium longisporum]